MKGWGQRGRRFCSVLYISQSQLSVLSCAPRVDFVAPSQGQNVLAFRVVGQLFNLHISRKWDRLGGWEGGCGEWVGGG